MKNFEELEKGYEVSYNTIEAKQGAYYLYLQKKDDPYNPDKHFVAFETLSLREAIKFAKDNGILIRDGISSDEEDKNAKLVCNTLNSFCNRIS